MESAKTIELRHEVKRKLIHYAALIFPLATAATAQKVWVLAAIAIGILVIAALEILRKKDERLNEKLLRFFGGIHRPEEAHKTSALIYTFSGSFLTILIFPKPIAILALLYLVFGDGSAALVGKLWGRTPVFGKSLEGMLANLLTCGIVGFLAAGFLPLKISVVLFGASAAALAEVMPFPVNDNLSVPILSALAMAAW